MNDGYEKITVVITTCERYEFLRTCLLSFYTWNTYPIEKIIITEDARTEDGKYTAEQWEQLSHYLHMISPNVEIIVNETNRGQMRSLDTMWEKVSTPWTFHLEDDFFFIAPRFIEESLEAHRYIADKLPEGQKLWQLWLYAYSFHDKTADPIAFKHKMWESPDWQDHVIKTNLMNWCDPTDHSSRNCRPVEKSYYRVYNTSQRGWTIYTGLRKTEDVMFAHPWAEKWDTEPKPDNLEGTPWRKDLERHGSDYPNYEYAVAQFYVNNGYTGYWLKNTNWMVNRGADYQLTKIP